MTTTTTTNETASQLAARFVAALRQPVDAEDAKRAAEIDDLLDWIYEKHERWTPLQKWLPALQHFRDPKLGKAQAIASLLESLPINSEGVTGEALFFVIVCGEWVPCYDAEINPENGWAMCGVRHDDGTDAIAAQPGMWAHVTADNQPCMPWCWNDCDAWPTAWDK